MKANIIFLVLILKANNVGSKSLRKGTERLPWADGMVACGAGYRFLTIEDVPLSDKAWSEIQFDNDERLWVGEYYKTTPFYWTTAALCLSIPDPLSQTKLTNNSLENCAIYCTGNNTVNQIAIQGDSCYCLGQNFDNGCKYPSKEIMNLTCGAKDEKKFCIYTKLSDKRNDVALQSDVLNSSAKHCVALYRKGSQTGLTYFLRPLYCNQERIALCNSGSSGYNIVQKKNDWGGAKNECESRNMSLGTTSFSSLRMTAIELKRQYWIGLRRFNRKIALGNKMDFDTNPSSCVAVEKQSGLFQLVSINCTSKLKYICLRDQKDNLLMKTARTTDNAEDEKITDTTCTSNQGIAWIIVGIVSFILLVILGISFLNQIRRNRKNQSMTTSRTRNNVDRREHPEEINRALEDHCVQSPCIEEALSIDQYDNLPMNADLAQFTAAKETERQSTGIDHEYTTVVDEEKCTSTQTYEETMIPVPDHVYSSLRLK